MLRSVAVDNSSGYLLAVSAWQLEERDNFRVKGIIMRIRALLSSILQILNRRALTRALKYLLLFLCGLDASS